MSMVHSQLALLRDVLGVNHHDYEHHSQNDADTDVAKRLYESRRMRDQFFPDALFADPAWDILLDLFIARRIDRRICVSSACIGACVPATTALRWLDRLEQSGLVERERSSNDSRSIFVRLTDDADDRMSALLSRISAKLLKRTRRHKAESPPSYLPVSLSVSGSRQT